MKNKIKYERTLLDLTQEQLAKKIQISRGTMNAIENNVYSPSLILAFRLSRIFNKPIEAFFEYDENEEEN
jgi:putative transcriptional regulator